MAKLKVKPVFEKIVIQHLKDRYGSFEKHKDNSKKYWRVGHRIIRPYYYPDPRTELFINAISKKTLESVKQENAYFVGATYWSKNGNVFTVYFIHPRTIQKYYVDAEITTRTKGEWHFEVKHNDNYLIFYRKGAEEAIVPVDDDNFYVNFVMSTSEYRKLNRVLPRKKKALGKKKATLKVIVAGDQETIPFTGRSSIVIALLSVLAKSSKALKPEEILSNIVHYGVLTRASDNKEEILSDLADLLKTGAISVTTQGAYRLTDSIKVSVTV